jgi:MFS transporter, DHA2 family, methylenomycin A resistance protein
LLLPASLSLLTHAYPDPARRAFAVGIWSSTAAVAFATSPLLAGLLIAVILLALTLFGIAGGSIPAVYSAAVASVPASQVGVASSALNAARQVGGVLGIAVLGGLVSASNFVSGLALPMALCSLSFAGVSLVGVRMRSATRAAGLPAPAPAPVRA